MHTHVCTGACVHTHTHKNGKDNRQTRGNVHSGSNWPRILFSYGKNKKGCRKPSFLTIKHFRVNNSGKSNRRYVLVSLLLWQRQYRRRYYLLCGSWLAGMQAIVAAALWYARQEIAPHIVSSCWKQPERTPCSASSLLCSFIFSLYSDHRMGPSYSEKMFPPQLNPYKHSHRPAQCCVS